MRICRGKGDWGEGPGRMVSIAVEGLAFSQKSGSKAVGETYFGLSCPLVHFSASQDSIEGKAAVLAYWGKGVEAQMPTSHAGFSTRCCRWVNGR